MPFWLSIAILGLAQAALVALPRARRGCETAPGQYYAWLIQARCQRDLGFTAAARESLQHCLDLCPGHVDAGASHLAGGDVTCHGASS